MLYLFNVPIMATEGTYQMSKVSLEEALEVAKQNSTYTSAIGHEGVAEVFNTLGFYGDVKVNRINAEMASGDIAISLKLRGRLPEGEIISKEKMEEIGFDFFLIKKQ